MHISLLIWFASTIPFLLSIHALALFSRSPTLEEASFESHPNETNPIYTFEELASSASDHIKSQYHSAKLLSVTVIPIFNEFSPFAGMFRSMYIVAKNPDTNNIFTFHNTDGAQNWTTPERLTYDPSPEEYVPFDWKDLKITLSAAFSTVDDVTKQYLFSEVSLANYKSGVKEVSGVGGGFYYRFTAVLSTPNDYFVDADKGDKYVGAKNNHS